MGRARPPGSDPGRKIGKVGISVPRGITENTFSNLKSALLDTRTHGLDHPDLGHLNLSKVTGLFQDVKAVAGPSQVWTTSTPWISDSDYRPRKKGEWQSRALESLGYALLSDGSRSARRDRMRQHVIDLQVSRDSWLPQGSPAAAWDDSAEMEPQHLRVIFTRPMTGPITVGQAATLGMGLLIPDHMGVEAS